MMNGEWGNQDLMGSIFVDDMGHSWGVLELCGTDTGRECCDVGMVKYAPEVKW